MESELEVRKMNLTYASHCGNPTCERGQLPSGLSVIICNKRIYCGPECATAHLATARTRPGRKAATKKVSAAV